MKLLYLLISIFILINCHQSRENNPINQDTSLSVIIDSLSVNPENIFIKIDKSDYILNMCYDTIILKTYPVVFGGNPVNDKRMQGDQCTPEGEFKILSKYPHKSWSKFIWIDYPNKESWKKHNTAKANGEIPKNAKIGGEIGIHGVPDNINALIDLKQNWTLGCISLKNKDVNEIYPYVQKGTKVIIEK